jgi:hypothetical protein
MKMDIKRHKLSATRGARLSLEVRRNQAVYFEYFEKYLVRVAPPRDPLEYFEALEYEVCFRREGDIAVRGGASHTIRSNLPAHGIPLLPVKRYQMPAMTDLLALAKETWFRWLDELLHSRSQLSLAGNSRSLVFPVVSASAPLDL